MDSPSVTVSYHSEKTDLRAAARLACHVVPSLVRVRRVALVLAAVLVLAEVVVLATGGDNFVVVALLGTWALGMGTWASTWFWAWQSTRSPISRRTLGEITFHADAAGIATSIVGSSGTHAWSSIDTVAVDGDSVVFTIGRQLYVYVPVRALTETERATLRYLVHSSGGPEWVDRRTPASGAAGAVGATG